MNPIYVAAAVNAALVARKCPHCARSYQYPEKPAGKFYTCENCGHRFKEYGQKAGRTARGRGR